MLPAGLGLLASGQRFFLQLVVLFILAPALTFLTHPLAGYIPQLVWWLLATLLRVVKYVVVFGCYVVVLFWLLERYPWIGDTVMQWLGDYAMSTLQAGWNATRTWPYVSDLLDKYTSVAYIVQCLCYSLVPKRTSTHHSLLFSHVPSVRGLPHAQTGRVQALLHAALCHAGARPVLAALVCAEYTVCVSVWAGVCTPRGRGLGAQANVVASAR